MSATGEEALKSPFTSRRWYVGSIAIATLIQFTGDLNECRKEEKEEAARNKESEATIVNLRAYFKKEPKISFVYRSTKQFEPGCTPLKMGSAINIWQKNRTNHFYAPVRYFRYETLWPENPIAQCKCEGQDKILLGRPDHYTSREKKVGK